jgi:hypothetical protein
MTCDAFAIALGGRAANEILGLLDREVSVREEEKELLAEEVRHITPSPPESKAGTADRYS